MLQMYDVEWSVCLPVTTVSCINTAEQINQLAVCVSPRKHAFRFVYIDEVGGVAQW